MAVVAAVALASLCADCIATQTGIPVLTVVAELSEINVARRRQWRPTIGPIHARCQRCDVHKSVYRLG